MKQVQSNLKTAQDRKQSHANLKRTPKEFQVGEHVFLRQNLERAPLNYGDVLN